MAKIENDVETAPKGQTFRVAVSFDGLDKGDVFTQYEDPAGWAQQHVATGYLQEVSDGQPGEDS